MSFVRSYVIERTHVPLNQSSVTFDLHLEQILGSILTGATVVLLHPAGHLDMAKFATTIRDQQVTFVCIVPSQLINLLNYVQSATADHLLRSVRWLICLGKSISVVF